MRILCLLAALLTNCLALAANVRISQEGDFAVIRNDLVRVRYDLRKGEYSVAKLSAPAEGLYGAHFELNEYRSNESDLLHTWSGEKITDDLGQGARMIVSAQRQGRPPLLLGITLYEHKPYVVLDAGLSNATGKPIQLKHYAPLVGATAYEALDGKTDIRFLNGASGAEDMLVSDGPFGESANNLLLTFKAKGIRKSMVLGGLTHFEFAKVAGVGQFSESARVAELERLAPGKARLSSYLDCGAKARTYVRNHPMTWLERNIPLVIPGSGQVAAPWFATAATGAEEILLHAHGFNTNSQYFLGFSWWDYEGLGREQSITYEDASGKQHALQDKQRLPDYSNRRQAPFQGAVALPPEVIQTGQLKLRVKAENGKGAVLSEVWIWTAPRTNELVAPTLPPPPLLPEAVAGRMGPVRLVGSDPVGRRIDPGTTYVSRDRFYVDLVTSNPFEALEQYALVVRTAMEARPNLYQFPTVCAWYASSSHPGCEYINTTAALVGEMDHAAKSGFLKYAPVGVRIVPDSNSDKEGVDNNEQGWWDDEHWRRFGHYTEPYETSAKWGRAVTERGGIPITYVQTGLISIDFVEAHPEWVLNNDASQVRTPNGRRNNAANYDYTDPGFQEHLRQVWGNLRKAGVKGVMFDYPGSGWRAVGGFEDKSATTAAAYRKIFEAAKSGLGPDSYIDERIIGQYGQPQTDLSAGYVDSQRTEWDTAVSTHDMYAKCGLRWYKNRTLFTYDMDAKNFRQVTPANRDGLRQLLTMAYLVAPRLLLGTSFRTMTPEQVHDLSRIYPLHEQLRNARPLDAFVRPGSFPQIYDLEVEQGWHQLALCNASNEKSRIVKVALNAAADEGGPALDPSKAYHIYDFWNETYVGKLSGSAVLQQELRPGEVRMLSVRAAVSHPQVLSTSRHLMQGMVDLREVKWRRFGSKLTGEANVVAGEPFKIMVARNQFERSKSATAGGADCHIAQTANDSGLECLVIERPETGWVQWEIQF